MADVIQIREPNRIAFPYKNCMRRHSVAVSATCESEQKKEEATSSNNDAGYVLGLLNTLVPALPRSSECAKRQGRRHSTFAILAEEEGRTAKNVDLEVMSRSGSMGCLDELSAAVPLLSMKGGLNKVSRSESDGCLLDLKRTSHKIAKRRNSRSDPLHKASLEWFRRKSLDKDANWESEVLRLVDNFEQECRSFVQENQLLFVNSHQIIRDLNDFAHGKELLKSLQFDVLCYSSDTLIKLCVEIFIELDLLQKLSINKETLVQFVSNVRDSMPENPYHNWYHVVDVAQAAYSLGLASGVMDLMSDTERLALLVAALCHDLEHPGVNNGFLVRTRSALSSLYGLDGPCLENHHSFLAYELITREESSLLDHLPPEKRAEVVGLVDDLILATDMGRHKDYMTSLRAAVDRRRAARPCSPPGPPIPRTLPPPPPATLDAMETHTASPAAVTEPQEPAAARDTEEAAVSGGNAGGGRGGGGIPGGDVPAAERKLMAEILMKCADTSNVVKPFPVAMRWAMRITEELYGQGDLERRRGLDITPVCDRHTQSRVGLQKAFIDAVAAPLYTAAAELLPRLQPAVDRLRRNRALWERYPSDAAFLADAAGCPAAAAAN